MVTAYVRGAQEAGLANLLKELPSNFEHRRFYEKLFREMAAVVGEGQAGHGYCPYRSTMSATRFTRYSSASGGT